MMVSDFQRPQKWSSCRGRDGQGLSGCKNVTQKIIKESAGLGSSNGYHQWERMVVILPAETYQDWLEVPLNRVNEFLVPYPADALLARAPPVL